MKTTIRSFSFAHHGKTFTFPDIEEDYISRAAKQASGFYEMALLDSLREAVPSSGMVLDVGANIGNHSVYFAKLMNSAVLAVEPLPRNIEMLHWMAKENNLRDRIFPVPLAAGDKSGWSDLSPIETDHVDPYGSQALMMEESDYSIRVPVATVDSIAALFAGEGDISLIKIDVEGYEKQVLEGAVETINRHKPHLAIEIAREDDFREIDRRLVNYRAVGKFNATPTYHFAPRPRHD